MLIIAGYLINDFLPSISQIFRSDLRIIHNNLCIREWIVSILPSHHFPSKC